MSPNASQNKGAFSAEAILEKDIDEFLGSGLFIGFESDFVLLAWGKPARSGAPNSQPQFYLPDFYLEDKAPWYTFPRSGVYSRSTVVALLQKFLNQPTLDIQWVPPEPEEFRAGFQFVKSGIESGQISKGVPVVFARANGSMTKTMRAKAICNLLKKKESTPYGFLTPTSGIIGASPELLLSVEQELGQIKTMALAGTRASAIEKTNPLLADQKELAEHDFVVQGIIKKTESLGSIEKSDTKVWDLGTISHLRTDFVIQLQNTNLVDLPAAISSFVTLLHPTAALGVAPVSVDWKILKACDAGVHRGRFGAPFGFLNIHGKSAFHVGIRNLQWNENGMMVGAGCGVVAQSEFENEWNEIKLKQKYTIEMLGL